MKSVSKTIRLDESLDRVIRERARREYVDESTAARQLLRWGAIEYAVQLNHQGVLTYREAAALCGLDVRDFLEELFKRGPPPDRPMSEVEEELDRAVAIGKRLRGKPRNRRIEVGADTGTNPFLAADRPSKKR